MSASRPTRQAIVAMSLTVNGKSHRVRVPPMKRLLDVLREDCGLTGSKEGCGEGECGACTVLLDGRSVNSCLVPAVQADGAQLVTVEGLAARGRLSALQQAFVEKGGAQCGICTPGMLVSAFELLGRSRGKTPSDAEVREALAGNLCRCTGYQKIVDAVQAAARDANARTRARSRAGAKRKAAARKTASAKSRRRTGTARTPRANARRLGKGRR